MASLVRCHKCKKMVNVKNTALCSACNNRYELNCDGYPEATYKLKDAEGKKKWRCTACVRQKKYSNAEVSASSVTLRKKPTLKIKSPIEHNTKLQPPRAPQNTSLPDSHDVLTDCEISDESYNNSSFLSTNSNARSLPGLSPSNCQEISYLQTTINDLKGKLEKAHMEIENLILEKSALHHKLQDQEIKIQTLTKICSPVITTPKRETRNINEPKTLNIQVQQEPEKPKFKNTNITSQKRSTTNTAKLNTEMKPLTEKVNINHTTTYTTQHIEEKTRTTCTPVCSAKNVYPNGKIHILGTQQIAGLTKRLHELRLNSSYEKYSVEGIIKHYATSKQLLNTEFQFKPFDKFIICVGENDSNPTTMLSELYMFINKYNSCPIIILSVLENKYLNEKLLNNNLELICNINKNCYFLRTHSNTCHKLNVLIDSIDYDNKYLNFNKSPQSKCAELPSYFSTNLSTKQTYQPSHSYNYKRPTNNCFRN